MQKTFCNGIKSDFGKVTFGVPQGSILGPLFFLVYINDIQNVLENNSYQLYADDTLIYCSSKSKDLAGRKFQYLLNKFSKWCSQNGLTINNKKTKIMTFGTRSKINKIDGININIGNENLQVVPSYKYLGFNLDQTLNFKHHLELLINNISFKLYLFSKIRRFINEKCAIIDRKMDRQHIRGMRTCLNNGFNLDENELFVNCKVANLENRRKVHVRNFMFTKRYLCDENANNINTRLHDGPVFKIPHPNGEAIKRNPWYGGSLEWNNLDAELRNIKDKFQFKRIQKSWMLNTYAV